MPLYQTYLELYPEGESARHIRCVESLGFSYGHRPRKDIIGDGINRATESNCCAHHRILPVKGCCKYCGAMTELKRMHEVHIEQPHPIERLWRVIIGLLFLCLQPFRDQNGVPDENRAYCAADKAARQSRPPSRFGASLEWAAQHRLESCVSSVSADGYPFTTNLLEYIVIMNCYTPINILHTISHIKNLNFPLLIRIILLHPNSYLF